MHISAAEVLVVAGLIFLVFGPKKLPGAARSIGRAYRIFKREMNSLNQEFEFPPKEDSTYENSEHKNP